MVGGTMADASAAGKLPNLPSSAASNWANIFSNAQWPGLDA
jgi:hypothetical protein